MRREETNNGLTDKLKKWWGILCDFLISGLLCGLLCLPVITAGASVTAALEYGFRRLREREASLFSEFFATFKKYFKPATALWLPIMLAAAVICANLIFYYRAADSWLRIMGLAFCIAAALLDLLLEETAFACLLFFPGRWAETVRRSLWLGLRHFGQVLLSVAIKAGLMAAALYVPVLWIAVPGLMLLFHCLLLRAAFRKYDRTEDGEDSSIIIE